MQLQLISTAEIVIRVIFFFLSLIKFAGLAWSGEYNSAVDNSLNILLIIILLFLTIKSIKSTKKLFYITINIIGLGIAIYFIYIGIFIVQNVVLPYAMEAIGFVALIFIAVFLRRD